MRRTSTLAVALALALLVMASGAAQASPAQAPTGAVRAVLAVAASSAPVGTEVPFTLTVTPAALAAHHGVRLQVRNRAGVWVTIDGYRLPRSGVLRDTLTGIDVGLGRYRAIVLGPNGILATSGTTTVAWTAPRTRVGP